MVERIQEHLVAGVEEYPISFSIGVAFFFQAPANVTEMLRKADVLMYSVKNTTKDAIFFQRFEVEGETREREGERAL